jgi:transglutaminase-like putative cysteine protease
MLRLLARGTQRWKPNVGWTTFILVVIAVEIAVMGVIDAEWVREDILFLYVTTVSLLASAILAHTRIPVVWGGLILGAGGLLYVGQVVAHFMPPVLGALDELWSGVTWLWLRAWQPGVMSPASPTFELWSESGARLATFGDRLSAWSTALVTGQSEQNPVAFLFVSGLILWASTAWAIWGIIRWGRPFLALFPVGLVLSMSTYLSSGHEGYLFGFVACATLLLPVVHLNREERRWEREGIDYSPEIHLDVWQAAALIMIIIMVFAIVTPSFSIPRLIQSFWRLISQPQEVIEDFMIRFFGGVEPVPPTPIPIRGGPGGPDRGADASLPRGHLLGGNPDLSNQLVMYVHIDAPSPIPEDIFIDEEVLVGPKYYWRGITYDTFSGRRWSNGANASREVAAYNPVVASVITNTSSLKQRYLIQVPHGDSLYAVGEPYTVDQAVNSRRRTVDDLVGIEGETRDYVVTSRVSEATVSQLEAVSETYSEYVVEKYLQLYRGIPDRVRGLASEITQDANTAHEKARAIEHYLRQFPYDLEVSAPPLGADVVDYFLFDVQRGYCDYYASSFVVLARLAGVPARLAVGYAMGSYSPECDCYLVVERDGHSWPEVYFPSYGWVPFEPTAAFRVFERPADPISPSDWTPSARPIPKRPWLVTVRAWWRQVSSDWEVYVIIAGGVALLVLLIAWMVAQWRYSRMSPVAKIALFYEEMAQLGEQLGASRRPSNTPAEYGVILGAAIQRRVPRWPWRGRELDDVVRQSGTQVRAISRAYERASYSAHELAKPYLVQMERQWQQLRRELRRLRYTSQDAPSLTGM